LVSQEAFAHIPNKAKLVQSCVHQLRPGGRMVFTDILWRQKPTPDDEAALFQGMRFSEIASVDRYQRLFAAQGLRCIDVFDLSDAWTQILIERHAMYRSLKAQTIQNLGVDHFERYDRAYDHFVNLFSMRKLGGALMQFAN
jgi:SAM-dependent methyltransferase